MKKKIILIAMLLLVSALMITCLAGCKKDGDGESTTEQTTAPKGDPVDNKTVTHRSLNFYPWSVTTDNDYIADAVIDDNNEKLKINVYSDGVATLTVKDYWDNTATVEVTVENSKITDCKVSAFSDPKSVNIKIQGGGRGVQDDTALVQKYIDGFKDGGTLYFPAGTYNLGNIQLREGITLKLQGKVEDIAAGYTDELAKRVADGEFAIFRGAFLTNYDINVRGGGNYGASNISIIGGMIDLNGEIASGAQIDLNLDGPANERSGGGLAFSRGENLLVQNVLFKDGYATHFIQLAGVKNATVKDCMFAGYVVKPNTLGSTTDILDSRETIQIEQGHAWACTNQMLNAGEFYYCENVTVDGCYFGDSDQAGYQLVPIGHHGDNGPASVTGLKITNNIFDNPYLAGIKVLNYVDVEITNNKFISEEKGHGFRNTALIDLVVRNWDMYVNDADDDPSLKVDTKFMDENGTLVSGKFLAAMKYESDGLKNFDISGNEFVISGNSDKRAISLKSSAYTYGVNTEKNVIKLVQGETYGKAYTGFVKSTNFASDISFTNNKISVTSNNLGKNAPVLFSDVYNLTVKDNTVELGDGVSFSQSYGGVSGISVLNEKNYVVSNTFTVNASLQGCKIILPNGKGGTITYTTSSSAILKLIPTEHVRFKFEITSPKELVITVVCDDGYAFDGWVNTSSSTTISGSLSLTAKVKTA